MRVADDNHAALAEANAINAAAPFGLHLIMCANGKWAVWYKLRNTTSVPAAIHANTITGAYIKFTIYNKLNGFL